MRNQIKELQATIRERQVSPEEASRFVGCSSTTVYRWLSGESIPTIAYQRKIKEGIRRIKAEYPDKKEILLHETMREILDIWLKLVNKMTEAEKDSLFYLHPKEHLAALKVLDKKYKVKAENIG